MNEQINKCELVRAIQELAAGQCAPVIFNIKPSNLLIIDEVYAKALKSLMMSTGLKARCFQHNVGDRQIWFLYREDALAEALSDTDNLAFIARFGYDAEMTMDEMLAFAARRFRMYKKGEIGFPHEMGIFLGYPLCDVKGFIEHNGHDYLCTGYWKVYENEQKAKETFRLYATVKQMALDMVQQGIGFGSALNYQIGKC